MWLVTVTKNPTSGFTELWIHGFARFISNSLPKKKAWKYVQVVAWLGALQKGKTPSR